jgi:hypothetical protein
VAALAKTSAGPTTRVETGTLQVGQYQQGGDTCRLVAGVAIALHFVAATFPFAAVLFLHWWCLNKDETRKQLRRAGTLGGPRDNRVRSIALKKPQNDA